MAYVPRGGLGYDGPPNCPFQNGHSSGVNVVAGNIVTEVFKTRFNINIGHGAEFQLWQRWLICWFSDTQLADGTCLNPLIAEIKKSMPSGTGEGGRELIRPPATGPDEEETKTIKKTLADITDFLSKNKTLLLILGALGLGYMWVSQKGQGGLPQIIMMGKQRKKKGR